MSGCGWHVPTPGLPATLDVLEPLDLPYATAAPVSTDQPGTRDREPPFWRRGWDLNPRHPLGVHLLSRQVASAAHPPLRELDSSRGFCIGQRAVPYAGRTEPSASQRTNPTTPATGGVSAHPTKIAPSCRALTADTPFTSPIPTTAPTTAWDVDTGTPT